MARTSEGTESNVQHAHPEQLHTDLHRLCCENDRQHGEARWGRKTDQCARVHLALYAGNDLSHFTRREGAGTGRQARVYRRAGNVSEHS